MGFMHVLNSWMIVFPFIVLLYYFFRKKYKKQVVSSTLFWEEAMHETKASPYLKKLQKNALLFLQLAALLLLVIAMMKPYKAVDEIKGEQVIFVVDTSATMLAGNDQSLFEKHKKELRRLIEAADGTNMTVITSGSQPQIAVRQQSNSRAVLEQLNKIDITYEPAQLMKSVAIAQSFIGQTPTSVYIFTDALEKTALPLDSPFAEWHVYGQTEKLDNVAITKFAAMQQGQSVTALIQITNETDREQTVDLLLTDQNGMTVKDILQIEPETTISHIRSDLAVSDALTATIDAADDYEADNSWLTVLQKPSVEILLDPNMHALVQKGFASVYDQVVFFDEKQLPSSGQRGLVVTNQVAYLDEKGPLLLMGRDDAEAVEVQQFADSSGHALFNFSPLEDVYVQALYPPFEQFDTIATVGEQPFIQLSDDGAVVVLADMQQTDWPLHPSFPLFLWSAIQQLASESDYLGAYSPMQNASIVVPQKEWSIFDADGEFIETITNGKQFTAPGKPGFYELTAASDQRYFTVELPAEERSLVQGETYQLGSIEATAQQQQGQQSFASWFVFAVILLLFAEWEVQRRRGFTN